VVSITNEAIRLDELYAAVESPSSGGVVVFVGRVRSPSHGKSVRELEYQAYGEMAESKMTEIARDVQHRWPVEKIAMVHRVGRLQVGEISVAIAVACPHRKEAFEACQYAIDRLKAIVPIWKKEFSETGSEWVG